MAEPLPTGTDPRWRMPARVWLRPLALLLGALLIAAVLAVIEQWLAAVLLAAFGLLMAYWTSPLRSGPHTPLATALERREDAALIVVWAPGDPLSARLHTAIRGERDDVIWVNAYQDPAAAHFVDLHGGRAALPLAVVGDVIEARVTVGRALDLQAAGKDRADEARRARDAEDAAGPEDAGSADPR